MIQKEKELFKSLCSFKERDFDESLLDAATPMVLGQLFFNRMQAVAYGTLLHHGTLGKVNREFRNSLKGAYEQNLQKNKSFFYCIKYLEEILSNCSCKYAMLKGAYLCKAYPEGYRTSNDIDLLVQPFDVTEIGNALVNAGFRQGNIRNGDFVATSRKEIIESKIMRGETVPYIKEIGLDGMRFLEVDINFSLDYKPGGIDLLSELIENTETKVIGDLCIPTLSNYDFFVHLCSHLYKEATTLPWVEMMRDMTLYKYTDIYMILSEMNEKQIENLFFRAKVLSLENVCAFAILQMSELFDFNNKFAVVKANEILKDDPEFIHRVVSPKEKSVYIYTEKSIGERFFSEDRKTLLRREQKNEKIKYEA